MKKKFSKLPVTIMNCILSMSTVNVMANNKPYANLFGVPSSSAVEKSTDSNKEDPKINQIIKKIEKSRSSESTTDTAHDQAKQQKNTAKKDLSVLQAQPENKKKDVAFNALVDELFPLSDQQIVELRKKYDNAKRATAASPTAPPTPITSTVGVSLAPGAPHPIIRLTKGFVSSLIFVDATGAPWPVVSYSIGDSEAFTIEWDQTSNALFVQSNFDYIHGNIAIRLKDLNTPLMLSFVSGQREIDYRVDLRVDARGPFASAPIIEDTINSSKNNKALINLLDGLPPKGSRKLFTNEEHGQAWLKDNRLYFRTNLTLLSPAWISTISSADGTRVYELSPSPNLLASKDGNTFNVSVGGL